MPVIKVQPLTPEAFQPFGVVLQLPQRSPDIETEINRYWDDAAPFRVTGAPQLGFLEAHRRPFVVEWMEFHKSHTQGFIPLGGESFIIAVAPPGTPLVQVPYAVQAFLMEGSCGVIIHQFTWHHVLFPLAPRAHAIVLLQQGVRENDMFISRLVEPVEIVLEEDGGA